jgi:hypothetical protein
MVQIWSKVFFSDFSIPFRITNMREPFFYFCLWGKKDINIFSATFWVIFFFLDFEWWNQEEIPTLDQIQCMKKNDNNPVEEIGYNV